MFTAKEVLKEEDLLSSAQRLKITNDKDIFDSSVAGAGEERILSHPIAAGIISDEWKVLSGPKLFERANHRPKPLMVGVLLVPNEDSMGLLYNMKERRKRMKTRVVNRDINLCGS